jgi:thioredoxin reductase
MKQKGSKMRDLVHLFAAGDVRYGSVKRVTSAVGAGAIAIQSVHEYPSSVPQRAGAPSGEIGSLL